MDISKRIVVTFVTVALIPILVISTLSVLAINDVSNANAADAAEELKAEELANLVRLSNDTGLFIEERWKNYVDGVYMMEAYCEDLFNERINATARYSYYWDQAEEPNWGDLTFETDQDIVDAYFSDYITFQTDCYYMPRFAWNNNDPHDLSAGTQYALDVSSNMVNVFKALHAMNEDYRWLYMGFDLGISDQHLFRNYPFDDLIYFQWDENEEIGPPEDDYDPNSEDWYTNVVAQDPGDDSVVFTEPYIDPSVGLVISMGRPVRFDNGSLIGVVSADVTMATINENVLSLDVLSNGYAYLLDRFGNVIAHPELGVFDEPIEIEMLEFGSLTSSEAETFNDLLVSTVLVEDSGLEEFQKNGQLWHMAFANVANTDYVLAIIVPDSDVIGPAVAMLNLVGTQTLILTLALGAVLAIVAGVVTVVSYRRAHSVIEPITEMTRLVNKMARQDFTRGITTAGAMYEEVGTTVDALLSFQEAARFGNQAFIRGDLNRALANYQNLLEISRRLEIDVGEQIMLLNIGNVFRQRGDTGSAMNYYEQSMTLAKHILERTKEDGADEKDALMRVASLYHNMALVEMDRGNADKAMELLEDAEAIDRTMQNQYGLAKRFDAMGLVMMRDGRYSQAQSKFDEAQKIAKSIDYIRSLAYIHYHEGELYQVQAKWKKAEDNYKDAISYGQETDELWLVVFAMQRLADVLDQRNKPSHDVRRKAEKLRRSIMFKKSVTFVIDYSGSMQAQNRIRAAVQGALEILYSQVNPQDAVSVIVFNSSYRELLPLTIKGERDDDENKIVKTLKSLKYPNYATAFYDALGRALEELEKIESSEHRWIIALTDGQDNSSETYSLDVLEGIITEEDRMKRKRPLTIEGFIRDHHLDVNLLIIGVGQELSQRADTDRRIRSAATGQPITTEELLESICERIPQGQYISVVDSSNVRLDIERAFEKVGVLMAQLEVGGTTTDY
ncbi:MAG: Methyl-accepting chemotaxis protein McpC [Candidatus Thorarchaeota archaeon AB_25]|nr:MAG: Methyl-accepting chemotaxis protein McpC [Candidatus Thorarchaeota archaeon AB_25]